MGTIFASIFNQKAPFKMRKSVAIFFATHCDVTLMETSTYSCCCNTVTTIYPQINLRLLLIMG